LPDAALGRSGIAVRRREPDGTWISAEVSSPLFHDYGAPSLLLRGKPESLLTVWAARSLNSGYDVTYAARLDCIEEQSATYEAFWGPPMALGRVHIIKRDPTRDVCFHIGLVFPVAGSHEYDVILPDKWRIEELSVQAGAASCSSAWQPSAVHATAATGTIDWPGSTGGQEPCSLDFGFSASFPMGEPWVPTSETFSATGLAVQGGSCGN
jgi:hypothetical protein